ncbi:MAG: LysR family transcriptional regulator [Oscillospiraceae bacterium]|nr:LysR family transcriptional regulator [Oscillospiraceae bacterium]
MVNESTVKTFLTLARVGKFTEAAKQLYLSQQAVSKQMAKLEQDLGCTLFNRERGRLSLTPEGEIYFRAFSQVDEIVAEAHREAAKLGSDWSRTLNIGMPELMEIRQDTRALHHAFRVAHPEIKIKFSSAPHWTMLEWLEDGVVDVAFTFSQELADNRAAELFSYVSVGRQQEMLVVSSDDPRATPDASFMDFRNDPVFYTPDPTADEMLMARRMLNFGFSTQHLIPTENLQSSVASVEQMEGVMFLLDSCRLVQSAAFRSYPTGQFTDVVLAWRKDLKKRCARAFVESVSQSQRNGAK